MKILLCSVLVIILLTGCTDRMNSALKRFGEQADVICYSGGITIYQGKSSGKVSHSENNFISFVEVDSGLYLEITGTCIIKYTFEKT